MIANCSSHRRRLLFALSSVALVAGCGTMKNHMATEQLLISDAIERAIDQIDFSPLANSTVYLDTQYITKVTAQGFLNNDYIRSALRERLMMSKCKLSENAADAEFVVEVRVGALGTDAHEVNYGIPASQPIASTASILSGSVAVPALPEVSFAKKDERRGAATFHVFAFRRETMEPVWQPEVAHGRSSARSTWVFGAGPFEKGTIYRRTRFAGAPIEELEVDRLPAIATLRDGIRETGDVFRHGLLPIGPGVLANLIPSFAAEAENVPNSAIPVTGHADVDQATAAGDETEVPLEITVPEEPVESSIPAFSIPPANSTSCTD
jgi:hypothetical protein